MRERIKEIFFPLFALFVLFNGEIFTAFFVITGITLDTGMRARQAILIAGIAYFMLAVDIVRGRLSQRNMVQLAVLGLILALYILTGFFHRPGFEHIHHRIYMMLYGALCIPAAYVGMRLAKGGYESRFLRFLPFFLLLIILSIGYLVIFRAAQGSIVGFEEGDVTSYQGASYALSFSCSYCLFWLFFANQKNGALGKIMYCAVLVMAFVSGIGCIVGGGRGAFLHLICSTAYIIYRVLGRNERRSRFGKYFLIVAGAIVMVYLSIHFNIFESAGAMRVANNLMADSAREYARKVAIDSFLKSPILGHGVGSVWWEVGFYSHNVLLDFLVETGGIGALIMVVTVCTMLIKLMKDSKTNSLDMFILLVMLAMLVEHTFSGYWIASHNSFLVFGYVYGKNRAVNRRYARGMYGRY